MLFLQLFLTFFKIGLFGFGGGYAMLSMIQGEVVTKHHWLTSYEFTDIVAMSQMTPGPIGINSATYVGYTAIVNAGYSHAIGILGSMTSTFAVVLPSFILMILISRFFLRYQKHPVIASVFSGLRPGVVGLLAAASLVLMNEENFGTETRQILISCIIFIAAFIASYKFKVSPILLICICGVLGLLTSCYNGNKGGQVHDLPLQDNGNKSNVGAGRVPARKYPTTAAPNSTSNVGAPLVCSRKPWSVSASKPRSGDMSSAHGVAKRSRGTQEQFGNEPRPRGDTIKMHWSKLLCIIEYPDYTKAFIKNPWKTDQILSTYTIRQPLTHSIIYSSVHCALIDELGARQSIAGVCDLQYIYLDWVHEAVLFSGGACPRPKKGSIADCGSSINPDIEKIIDIHPDAILLSPYENNGGYGRLEKLGIPIIECADYMETSPLGRAEWIRFFGRLFGKAETADSIFAEVERQYLSLKSTADETTKPTLFAEMKTGAAWYVPGGNSTMGQIYQDAGANYVFSYLDESGSAPLSFETVFEIAQDADIWLIKYNQATDKTYSELLSDYEPYKGFRAFREHNVYGCNTSKVHFYEETPFHPERLLADLVRILHPTQPVGAGRVPARHYFTKLQQ